MTADFSLKLPGFSLSVLGYLGGEDYLRYVTTYPHTFLYSNCLVLIFLTEVID